MSNGVGWNQSQQLKFSTEADFPSAIDKLFLDITACLGVIKFVHFGPDCFFECGCRTRRLMKTQPLEKTVIN